MPREILDIRGLRTNTTPRFRQRLVEVADERDLDPSFLAAVISFETGGSFDPSATNSASGATGLIQWLPRYWPVSDLPSRTALEQLDFVRDHYAKVDPHKRISLLEDHYLAVFSPKWLFADPSTVMYSRPAGGCPAPPKGAYCQNAGLDANKDGHITKREAAGRVQALVDQAEGRPPLLVGGAPDPGSPPGGGTPPVALTARPAFPASAFVLWGAAGFAAAVWWRKRSLA